MKTIEEKAEAYDKALHYAKIYYSEGDENMKIMMSTCFPELKESEDEKIRKDLIQWINGFPDTIWRGHYKKDVVAWLEKQAEQKPTDEEMKTLLRTEYEKGRADAIAKMQKEWSEEDEEILDEIIVDVEVLKEQERTKDGKAAYQKEIDWLKSLKGRVLPQPKQEWSEEDESILQGIWDEILANKHDAEECEWKTYDKFLNWLKSLRPHNAWKPSDEQICLLQTIINEPNNAASESCQIVLKDILEQLKKLKEE